MPYAALPHLHEDLDELRRLLRAERHPERKRRLHMLVLFKEDPTRSRRELAEHLAVHRNTIRRWLSLYDEQGLDGLLALQARGVAPGQRTVPEPVCQALVAPLDQPSGFAGYDDIQQGLCAGALRRGSARSSAWRCPTSLQERLQPRALPPRG